MGGLNSANKIKHFHPDNSNSDVTAGPAASSRHGLSNNLHADPTDRSNGLEQMITPNPVAIIIDHRLVLQELQKFFIRVGGELIPGIGLRVLGTTPTSRHHQLTGIDHLYQQSQDRPSQHQMPVFLDRSGEWPE